MLFRSGAVVIDESLPELVGMSAFESGAGIVGDEDGETVIITILSGNEDDEIATVGERLPDENGTADKNSTVDENSAEKHGGVTLLWVVVLTVVVLLAVVVIGTLIVVGRKKG